MKSVMASHKYMQLLFITIMSLGPIAGHNGDNAKLVKVKLKSGTENMIIIRACGAGKEKN